MKIKQKKRMNDSIVVLSDISQAEMFHWVFMDHKHSAGLRRSSTVRLTAASADSRESNDRKLRRRHMAATLPLCRSLHRAVNRGEFQRRWWGEDVKNDMPWKISYSHGSLSRQRGGAGPLLDSVAAVLMTSSAPFVSERGKGKDGTEGNASRRVFKETDFLPAESRGMLTSSCRLTRQWI